ncbi:hypothetical protein MTO96_009577 [Rhipicephalus appendiculatus]
MPRRDSSDEGALREPRWRRDSRCAHRRLDRKGPPGLVILSAARRLGGVPAGKPAPRRSMTNYGRSIAARTNTRPIHRRKKCGPVFLRSDISSDTVMPQTG